MIRIIKGTYGMIKGSTVVAVPAGSKPIKLDPEKEARLVRQGVAEYVGKVEEPDTVEETVETVEAVEAVIPAPADEPDEAEDLPPYDENMKFAELKEIAEKYGIDASKMKSKKEVIAAIDEARELPDLSAADPIG